MYGLLLEAISTCLKTKYGEEKWEEISKLAGLRHACFSTHETYSEDLLPNIAKAASRVLGESADDIMDSFGVSFVSFVGQYGYDSILKVGNCVEFFLLLLLPFRLCPGMVDWA